MPHLENFLLKFN